MTLYLGVGTITSPVAVGSNLMIAARALFATLTDMYRFALSNSSCHPALGPLVPPQKIASLPLSDWIYGLLIAPSPYSCFRKAQIEATAGYLLGP